MQRARVAGGADASASTASSKRPARTRPPGTSITRFMDKPPEFSRLLAGPESRRATQLRRDPAGGGRMAAGSLELSSLWRSRDRRPGLATASVRRSRDPSLCGAHNLRPDRGRCWPTPKYSRLRMREIETADGRWRRHRQALGEIHAGALARFEQIEERALLGVIGLRRIAGRRADAAILLGDEIVGAQRLRLARSPTIRAALSRACASANASAKRSHSACAMMAE